MATFTELCNDVYTITSRPDLVAETKLAVKAATLKMHQTDYYYKDLLETGIVFDTLDYTQQLDLLTIFPRFRALKYFRRYDNSTTGTPKEFFSVLTPKELVDSYGNDRTNVAYMAGSVLNIKSRDQIQYALLGIYQNPIIDEYQYNSWIAVENQFAIEYEAARLIFKQIGFDEQSSSFEKLVQEQVSTIRMSNILVEGY